MAGTSKTNYLENLVLLATTGGTNLTAPTNHYVALFTALTTANGEQYTSGSPTGTEVSGNGYARQSVTFGTVSLMVGTGSQVANTNTITFAVATPAGYGNVVAIGIFDAPTGGNLLYYQILGTAVPINLNAQAVIAIGSLVISED